jgi:hypothetical protein
VAGILGGPGASGSLIAFEDVSSLSGQGPSAAYFASALEDLYVKGVAIVSIAIIVSAQSVALEAMHNARVLGLSLVVAGGNQPGDSFPNELRHLGLGVASVQIDGTDLNLRKGPWIDVTAPASADDSLHDVSPWSTGFDGGYGGFGATSGATPHVAGIASLLLSHTPLATNEDLEQIILRNTTLLPGQTGYDHTFGHGLARLDQALCAVEERILAHGSKSTPTPAATLVATRTQTFRHAQFQQAVGNPDAENLLTEVYRYETSVDFLPNNGDVTAEHVWARGRECPGWRDTTYVNGLEDTRWAGIQSVTSTGCTMYTYFYKVFSAPGVVQGWHPFNPGPPLSQEPFQWRYSYLYEPLSRIAALPNDRFLQLALVGPRSVEVRAGVGFTGTASVLDVSGRIVRDLGAFQSVDGSARVTWDASDRSGRSATAGVYFLQVTAGAERAAIRIHNFGGSR